MVSKLLELLDTSCFLDEVSVGLLQPLEVSSLDTEWKLLVLVDWSVLHFIHTVKLSLEKNELFAEVRLGVHKTDLELLKGINNLKEVVLLEEEVEILLLSLVYWNQGLIIWK